MSRLPTLRVRFALWTAALLLAGLTLFGSFVYLRMAQSLAESVDRALRLASSQVAAEADIEGGELVVVGDFLQEVRNTGLLEQEFSFRVLNRGGQTLQEYGPYHNLPAETNFTEAEQPGIFTSITDAATEQPLRVYTAPIAQGDRIIGVVQVAQNLNNVRQILNQLLTTLLIGGPLLVVLAGLGGYILAARALAPIDKITRMARRISAEDLAARLNLPPIDDEAGRLAATFDSMLIRLDEAFQRERRFSADAAHELRTPLAAMQTMLGSMLIRRRTPAEYETVLADLNEETGRLHTLVEGLLQITRSDGTQSLAQESIDLSILLADVSDSLRPLAEAKGLTLTATIADHLTLTGDSDALIRLFVNLLDNAIKFTQQGQVSMVAHEQADSFVEVAIADTGVGIDAVHLPHLFGRFYRVDSSRTTSGAGLGLAIALSIAQAHGGTIQVESKIGQGSRFTVELAKAVHQPQAD